jgi:Bacterial Ig domain
VNGPGVSAQFNNPAHVSVDAAGNVYVGDVANHVIRKVTSDGVVSTLAGSGVIGSADGSAALATFKNPAGVAVLGSSLIVADLGNSLIRKVELAPVVPDTTAPTVSISAPTVGQVLPGTPVAMSGNAADNVGVTSVRVAIYRSVAGGQYWNGASWQAANTTVAATLASAGATNTAWSYVFNGPPGGVFAVAALAYDAVNNFGVASYRTFAIDDTTVPTVTLTSPTPSQAFGARPVTISGSATDNAGVGDVQIAIYRPVDPNGQFWNGSAWQTAYTTFPATLSNPGGTSTTFTYSFTPPQSGGYFYVAAVALDTSYRYAVTPFTLFTLPDAVAPTATIVTPVAGPSTGAVSITGSATDDVSVNRVGIAVYREATGQYWNGSGWQAAFTTFAYATLAAPGATTTSFSASYTPAVTGRLYVGVVPSDGNYNYTLSSWTIITAT